MSERQILVTIATEHWNEDLQEYLVDSLDDTLSIVLSREDYTIQEFEK